MAPNRNSRAVDTQRRHTVCVLFLREGPTRCHAAERRNSGDVLVLEPGSRSGVAVQHAQHRCLRSRPCCLPRGKLRSCSCSCAWPSWPHLAGRLSRLTRICCLSFEWVCAGAFSARAGARGECSPALSFFRQVVTCRTAFQEIAATAPPEQVQARAGPTTRTIAATSPSASPLRAGLCARHGQRGMLWT